MQLKSLFFSLMSTLACSAILTMSPVRAQQPPSDPVAEHSFLKETEGTWDAVVDSGGMKSKGVMTSKMELGGLWLSSRFEGEFAPGAKFQGHGLDGYDPVKKKFVSVWFDSMTYTPMNLTGDYDKAKKTMTMHGEVPGPDGNLAKVKLVTTYKDKDHHTFRMFMIVDGNEVEAMSIEYSRRKS